MSTLRNKTGRKYDSAPGATGHAAWVLVFLTAFCLMSACGGGGSSGGSGSDGSSGSDDEDHIPFETGTGFNDTVRAITPATDGSGDIYVGGTFTSYDGTTRLRIARLNSDGSLDTGFDPGGGFQDGAFRTSVNSIVIAADGSGDIYVGGDFTECVGTPCMSIARLNSDGSLDSGFNPGPILDEAVYTVAVAPNGSGGYYIYAGGVFTAFGINSTNRIIRLNENGSIDPGFSLGTGFNSFVWDIAIAPDGSGDIYVAGDFTAYNGSGRNRIARINDDGSIDTGFDTGTGFNLVVFSIANTVDGTGDLFTGGTFTVFRGNGRVRMARVDSNSANVGGFTIGAGFNALPRKVVAATDGSGDVYAGGSFSDFDGIPSFYLIRLNSDGSLDTGFDTGDVVADGLNDGVWDLALAEDGSGDVYVGGDFTTYQSVTANRIIRLNSSGERN